MIAKKNNKADLEKKRIAFLQIGLVIAGALVLSAFQYTNTQFVHKQKKVVEERENLPVLDEVEVEYVIKPASNAQPKKTEIFIDEVIEKNKVDKKLPLIKDKNIIKHINPIDDGGDEGDIIVAPVDNTLYNVVAVEPQFPGGYEAMQRFISENIELPHYAEAMNGVVYVRFIVEKDGTIRGVKLLNSLHSDYDKAALQVVSQMPKWKPGEQAGKKVRVQYEIPINFVNR
jgi:protein TonB